MGSTKRPRASYAAALAAATALLLSASASYAEGPFAGFEGAWSGTGTVSLSDGSKERIRCKANYRGSGGGNRSGSSDGHRRGDLGAVVETYEPDGLEVEFVTASGRTAALVTLTAGDVRAVHKQAYDFLIWDQENTYPMYYLGRARTYMGDLPLSDLDFRSVYYIDVAALRRLAEQAGGK